MARAGVEGSNISLTVPAAGQTVTFVWDQLTHIPTAHRELTTIRGPTPPPAISRWLAVCSTDTHANKANTGDSPGIHYWMDTSYAVRILTGRPCA